MKCSIFTHLKIRTKSEHTVICTPCEVSRYIVAALCSRKRGLYCSDPEGITVGTDCMRWCSLHMKHQDFSSSVMKARCLSYAIEVKSVWLLLSKAQNDAATNYAQVLTIKV